MRFGDSITRHTFAKRRVLCVGGAEEQPCFPPEFLPTHDTRGVIIHFWFLNYSMRQTREEKWLLSFYINTGILTECGEGRRVFGNCFYCDFQCPPHHLEPKGNVIHSAIQIQTGSTKHKGGVKWMFSKKAQLVLFFYKGPLHTVIWAHLLFVRFWDGVKWCRCSLSRDGKLPFSSLLWTGPIGLVCSWAAEAWLVCTGPHFIGSDWIS